MGKLPVLEDAAAFGGTGGAGSFFLPESGAILRYLCRTLLTSSTGVLYHFYPHADPAAAALVDAAVEWHFSSLRPGCSGVVWALVLAKTVPREGTTRREVAESPAAAAAALASLELALDSLEGRSSNLGGGSGSGGSGSAGTSSSSSSPSWLLSPEGGGFLAGRITLSIADLLVATELDQLRLLEAVRSEGEGGGGVGEEGPSLEGLLASRPRGAGLSVSGQGGLRLRQLGRGLFGARQGRGQPQEEAGAAEGEER